MCAFRLIGAFALALVRMAIVTALAVALLALLFC